MTGGTIPLLSSLGKGGWGEVFLAEEGGEKLAVKFLQPGLDAQALEFFKNEVRLLSRLSHPNLVKIFDFYSESSSRFFAASEDEGLPPKLRDLPCFTMEYLEGLTLEKCPPPKGFPEILDRFVQVARGLHYLHSRNILHRDLKPSNIQVLPSGQIKILDFNLSATTTQLNAPSLPLGTLPFMAPEVFRGEYSVASDLFSWGVVFYRWASGTFPFSKPTNDPEMLRTTVTPLQHWRPDFPDFFCRMVERLLGIFPSTRPSSAVSVLKYLNQHLENPLPYLTETGRNALLEKIPLIGRESALREIEALGANSRAQGTPALLHLTGPMGVGRSQLLEELKWRFQLEGIAFLQVNPGQLQAWRRGLEATESGFFSQAWVLAFSDLQNWQAEELMELKLFLCSTMKRRNSGLILLESCSDSATNDSQDLFQSLREVFPLATMALMDLSPEDAREFMIQACPSGILKENVLQRRVKASGGRPLLLLEGLKQELLGADPSTETNWQSLANLRIASLAAPTQKLFALLLSHPVEVTLTEIAVLSENYLENWAETLLALDQENLLSPRHPGEPQLKLAHLGLKNFYYQALSETQRHEAHRKWLNFLPQFQETSRNPGEISVWMAAHAWADGDATEIKNWGRNAAEYLSESGQYAAALEWLERLLPLSFEAEDQVQVNARLAPLYFRLGKFSESLDAYDRWRLHRQDDASRLQYLKFLYYTGFVYFNWGKKTDARERLMEALQIGDGNKYPSHRGYLSRTRATLAILCQKEGRFSEARDQLQAALPLAGDDALQQGEVEQCWGNLEKQAMQYDSALEHFERARESYHRQKNPAAEAQAMHSAGQALHEAGDLVRAQAAFQASSKLALQAGDLLQWARFAENSAMLSITQAHYAKAKSAMESAEGILTALAKPEDLRLLRLHRAILFIFTGNGKRVAEILQELERNVVAADGDFSTLLELWRAEWAYLRGNEREAQALFEKLTTPTFGEFVSWTEVYGRLGVFRCSLRWNSRKLPEEFAEKTLQILRSLPYPAFSGWLNLFETLRLPTDRWTEDRWRALSQGIKGAPSSEFRADAYLLAAAETQRRGLAASSGYFLCEYRRELQNIFQNLAEEDQMDFEKSRELKNLDLMLQETLSKEMETPPPPLPSPQISPSPHSGTMISEGRFRQYTQINRYISQNRPLEDILERVMDAAIELTGAERGFLLLKDAKAKEGPLKGFEVKTARHLSQRSLAQKEFQFSLSAVKQVVEQGTYLLSDNAQVDERLQTQKSVVLYQLKSILAFPLESENQIIGAIYVDHPFRQSCFTEENILLLSSLAGQAALAIQKAQLVEDLRRSQEKLMAQVENQAEKIEEISEKLLQVRSSLRYDYEEMIGQSPTMMRVFELLDHVTETAIPVWICGESGTGKELVARSLHDNSPRKKAAFVAENCSAIPENLLESELFGHKRGAFTHADRDRVGLFEQAHGGTLFLDEVADMSMAMQAKLLRVLQEGEVRPLGANRTVKVDVRLVTASNRDLKALVQEGKFRQDLFFRINGLTVKLPALRERKEDILLLAQHFIKKLSRDLNLKPAELGDAALQLLLRHPWPGNIRELEGVIRTALLFAKGRTLQPEHLHLDLQPFVPVSLSENAPATRRSNQEEESEERQMILEALKKCKMNKAGAAKKLGIGLRTLYTRMGVLGLPKKKTLLAKYLGLA